jgi:lipopolysaccharide biosynthesis regulator YciM
VLDKLPTHEPALVGQAWLLLSSGDVEAATKLVAPRVSAKGSSPALTTVYAAALRRGSDAAARDKAKELLGKLVETTSGADLGRAQLELARLHRDNGDFSEARAAYAAAVTAGNRDARFEYGLMLIEDRDPGAGRDLLDALLAEAGDTASAQLLIETARARMLVGDHAGAMQLLDRAEKVAADADRWKLARERGRLALRKSDFAAAAVALNGALDKCGADRETFLLAADVGGYEKSLADKVKKLAAERLKGRPEAKIVEGKLLIAAEKYDEADRAYRDAKTALKAEKASPRRLAQVDFGLGVIAYNRENSAEALQMFELVTDQDPSLVDTYMFAASITKDTKRAFAFAQKAVKYNPDYPGAWLLYGRTAHKLRDKKSLAQAVAKLSQLAPNGDELKELRALR